MRMTRDWLKLTEGEKLSILAYAVSENAKKWKRK